jgi:hypothetical protein
MKYISNAKVFSGVKSYNLVERFQRFGGASCLHLHLYNLKTESRDSSE